MIQGAAGIAGLLLLAWVFSENRRAVPWRAMGVGELFAIMVGGMASIAGTVLFLYASILGRILPDALAHLLIASIVSAPAALVIAFVMVPPAAKRPAAISS